MNQQEFGGGREYALISTVEKAVPIPERGWVEIAPLISEIIDDVDDLSARTHDFTSVSRYSNEPYLCTEAEGLTEVVSAAAEWRSRFHHAATQPVDERAGQRLIKLAESAEAIPTMAFIGRRELSMAYSGLAQHWLDQLLTDNNKELHVLNWPGDSAGFIARSILGSMKRLPDWHESFESRITNTNYRHLHSDPQLHASMQEHGIKIVDDWAISNYQLESNLRYAGEFVEAGKAEVNLVCATDQQLEAGLTFQNDAGRNIKAPINAYFRRSNRAVTGWHCSTDFDFNEVFDDGSRALRKFDPNAALPKMPSLAWVYRRYKSYKNQSRPSEA